MSVLLSVSESPHGVSLDAISLNSNKNFSSYLMWTDRRTDDGELNSSPSSLREAGNKNRTICQCCGQSWKWHVLEQTCDGLDRLCKLRRVWLKHLKSCLNVNMALCQTHCRQVPVFSRLSKNHVMLNSQLEPSALFHGQEVRPRRQKRHTQVGACVFPPFQISRGQKLT